MKYFFIIQAFIIFFALFINLWVIPSAVTSGIKAVSNSCEKTYPVEKVWSGNWFCEDKSGK